MLEKGIHGARAVAVPYQGGRHRHAYVFEKTPMSDGPMSTVRWVDMAVAPSGNVQLILDIFNKTGVPAYVSRLCSGPILSLRHVAVDAVQFVSPVASVATRGRWSQALNESLPANEPSAVAPGVRERRVLKFADRLNPCVARTVRVLSAPRPGRPHTCTSARMAASTSFRCGSPQPVPQCGR